MGRTFPHGWKEKAEKKIGTKKEADIEVLKQYQEYSQNTHFFPQCQN